MHLVEQFTGTEILRKPLLNVHDIQAESLMGDREHLNRKINLISSLVLELSAADIYSV